MKKSVVVVGLFFLMIFGLSFFVSAFSADSYRFTSDFQCEDYGIECGDAIIENINDIHASTTKSCGVCSSDKYCYNGKCINPTSLGTCERSPDFNAVGCSFFNDDEDSCNYYGCSYNQGTKKCAGTFGSCSFLMEKQCSELKFTPDSPDPSMIPETSICTYSGEYLTKYTSTEQECSDFGGEFRDEITIEDWVGDNSAMGGRYENVTKHVGLSNIVLCVYDVPDIDNDGSPTIQYSFTTKTLCEENPSWNGTHYSTGGLCSYWEKVNALLCVDKDTNLEFSGCKMSYSGQYEPQIYILYKDVPSNLIYLSSEDLESIKSGGTIPLSIKLINSGLPKDTPIEFDIYNPQTSNVLKKLNGVIDEQGGVNLEWLLSNEELLKIDFEGGRDVGYAIVTFVGGDFVPADVRVYQDPFVSSKDLGVTLKFKTKTGECLGEVSKCEDYDNWYLCHEAEYQDYGCTWTGDYESGSCIGGDAIPCDYSRDIKGVCQALGCRWKANNIFERFTDWIKGIFGR